MDLGQPAPDRVAALVGARAPSASADPVIGVALGGGGAAGMAHIGVLEELVAAGIPVRCIAGTSAGALVGAAFASGKLAELRDTLQRLSWSQVLGLFDPTWPRVGLFEGRRALSLVRPTLGPRIEHLPLPFAAIATDLHTGEEVVLDRGSTLDAVRASAALPGVFTPRRIDGRTLIDGGLVNPLPVSAARRLGAAFVVAVGLHPLPQDCARGPMAVANARLPEEPRELGLLDIVAQSSAIVQARIAAARLRDDPPNVLLIPPTAGVGLFELHRSTEVVAAGRRAARDALPLIRDALARARTPGAAAGRVVSDPLTTAEPSLGFRAYEDTRRRCRA